MRQNCETFGHKFGGFQFFHCVKHFLAQIAQAHTGVTLRCGFQNVGQHFFQRGVVVVVFFKSEQGIDQCAPFTFGNTDGEQHQNSEVSCFFRDDAVSSQVSREYGSRNAHFA